MTVETSYEVTIATLDDWLNNIAPDFQPMRSKTKTSRTDLIYEVFSLLWVSYR